MALRLSDHCGNPDTHEPHTNDTWDGPYCDGQPETLARQQEREANPPPGPPAPPRDWWSNYHEAHGRPDLSRRKPQPDPQATDREALPLDERLCDVATEELGDEDDAVRVVDALMPRVEQAITDARAEAHDAGVRQAVAWLRADYPAYSGPEWRERGAEWIEDRHADARRAALSDLGGDQ